MNPDPTSRQKTSYRLRRESDAALTRLLRLYAAGSEGYKQVQAELQRREQEKTNATNHEAKRH